MSDQNAPDSGAEEVTSDSAEASSGANDNTEAVENAWMDEVAKERDTYKSALQHLQADFENYRKRVNKQQSEMMDRANEGFAQKLLPVLDTIDLARTHDPNGSLEQVASALLEVLDKEGLERMPAVGSLFDPTQHEAVAHEQGEGGEPRVSEELRAGYRWKGRVVRPAMVKVVG